MRIIDIWEIIAKLYPCDSSLYDQVVSTVKCVRRSLGASVCGFHEEKYRRAVWYVTIFRIIRWRISKMNLSSKSCSKYSERCIYSSSFVTIPLSLLIFKQLHLFVWSCFFHCKINTFRTLSTFILWCQLSFICSKIDQIWGHYVVNDVVGDVVELLRLPALRNPGM